MEESTFAMDAIHSLDLSVLPQTKEEWKRMGIVYSAYDFAGQLEYISLHPVMRCIQVDQQYLN